MRGSLRSVLEILQRMARYAIPSFLFITKYLLRLFLLPPMLASDNGHLEIVHVLQEHGAV